MSAKRSATTRAPSSQTGLLQFFKSIDRVSASCGADAKHSAPPEPPEVKNDYTSNNPNEEPQEEPDELVPTATVSTEDPDASSTDEKAHIAEQSQVSEYERKRLARIAMNAQFLEQLGVSQTRQVLLKGDSKSKTQTTLKQRKRDWTEPGEVMTRRSTRLKGMQAATTASEQPNTVSTTVDTIEQAEQSIEYNDSNVLKYVCDSSSSINGAAIVQGTSERRSSLVGFEATSRTFMDPLLKKIYAIAFSPFKESALVAATGHQGHISIYAANGIRGDPDVPAAPLMSFRGHRGWISSLSLATSSPRDKNLLLSAANDGVVKLWDLNQSDGATGTAKELLAASHLHRNGIFGMDTFDAHVLTCSKDSTIALSTLQQDNGEISLTRRFEEHAGVVKCVEFSRNNPRIFASGGNDSRLRVFDTRVGGSGVVYAVSNACTRAINSVTWHPTNENLLLSASFDPDARLFDRRRPNTPVVVFHNPSAGGSRSIYHPRFLENGEYVVCTGPTTQDHLNLFRVSDGSAVSRGILTGKASYVACDPFSDRLIVAIGPQLRYYSFRRHK